MRILLIGFSLIIGYVAVYAGAVNYSKDRVVAELVAAVEANDKEAALARLDMGALRAFLKSDLKKKSRAVRSGNVGMMLGPEPEKVDQIVDFYVQDDKIDLLFELRPKVFPDAEPEDFIKKVSFDGPFAFSVTVGYPSSGDAVQPTLSQTVSSVTFVFKATGWKWEAKEMYVPLFMVPRAALSQEDIERLLSENPY